MKRKLDYQEVKERQLAILDYVAGVCRKHGIKWFIAYGTLIGAIRHHGYIPWDDDVDIAMKRKDYNHFLAVLKQEPHPYFKVLDMDTSPRYFNEFAKIHDIRTRLKHKSIRKSYPQGIFIDVFPIDCYNVRRVTRIMRLLDRVRYYSIIDSETQKRQDGPHPGLKRVLWYVLHILPPRFWARIILFVRRIFMRENGLYEGNLVSCLGEKERFPAGIFNDMMNVPFEGRMLPAPKAYDRILRQLYGDYMILPPEEERKRGHFEDVYE